MTSEKAFMPSSDLEEGGVEDFDELALFDEAQPNIKKADPRNRDSFLSEIRDMV